MRKRVIVALALILVLLSVSLAAGAEIEVPAVKSFTEVEKMQSEFGRLVGKKPVEEKYLSSTEKYCAAKISANADFQKSQFFAYTDRNPSQQLILVCFYDAALKKVLIIGADKTSTGNPHRNGFFETPLGFLKNTTEIMGYRAQGTKNSKGWRGLGGKGSRIWDFGWQGTYKNGCPINIRLLMHATDPDFGEARLGQVDSKGCIRISAKLNFFLDHYGIIDKEYEERNSVKNIWLLKADRKPTAYAGKYVLVGDSRNY
jgi:hypothetical protein